MAKFAKNSKIKNNSNKELTIGLVVLLVALAVAITVNELDKKKHPRPEPKHEISKNTAPKSPVLNWFAQNTGKTYSC